MKIKKTAILIGAMASFFCSNLIAGKGSYIHQSGFNGSDYYEQTLMQVWGSAYQTHEHNNLGLGYSAPVFTNCWTYGIANHGTATQGAVWILLRDSATGIIVMAVVNRVSPDNDPTAYSEGIFPYSKSSIGLPVGTFDLEVFWEDIDDNPNNWMMAGWGVYW